MSYAQHLAQIRRIRAHYIESVKSGRAPESAITRQWMLGDACKGCVICESIVAENPDLIGLLQLYRLANTMLEMPPAHDGCDCSEKYVTNINYDNRSQFEPPSSVRVPKQLPPIHLPYIPD